MTAFTDIHTKTLIWQIVNIVLVIGIPAALLCLLQWWLSRRQSPVPGLILPVLHVILSVMMILSVAAYSVASVTTVTTYADNDGVMVEDENGNVLALVSYPDEVPAESNDPQADESSVGIIGGADDPTAIYAKTESTIPTIIGLFLLFNIPTYIYIIIYGIERRKLHRNRTVDKTLIQDL